MTTPNHIAGGLLFAGIIGSFYSVNIFSHPAYVAIAMLGSLLPDIDSPRSLFGLILFPVSSYIHRRYGHRTITHSFIFVVVFGIVSYYALGRSYCIILVSAILSHCILDMFTFSGVLFLYPFALNPCVIPANRDLRFKTGNLKVETIAFVIFLLLQVSLTDLFAQGFWVSVQKKIASIKFVYEYYESSKNAVFVRYHVVSDGKEYKGTGYIVHATPSLLHLYNGTDFFAIEKQKIISLDWHEVTDKIRYDTITLPRATASLVANQVSGKYIKNLSYASHQIEFVFSPYIGEEADKKEQIYIVQYQIDLLRASLARIQSLTHTRDSADIIARSLATEQLKKMPSIESIQNQILQHQKALADLKQKTFTAQIIYITVPKSARPRALVSQKRCDPTLKPASLSLGRSISSANAHLVGAYTLLTLKPYATLPHAGATQSRPHSGSWGLSKRIT